MNTDEPMDDRPTPDSNQESTEPSGTYPQGGGSTATERELALRMIASRALADTAFYEQLKQDPEAAIATLHITLGEEDLSRIRDLDWSSIDEPAAALRRQLGFDRTLQAGW